MHWKHLWRPWLKSQLDTFPTRKRIIIINDNRNRDTEKMNGKKDSTWNTISHFSNRKLDFYLLEFLVFITFSLILLWIWFECLFNALVFLISSNRFLNQMNSPARTNFVAVKIRSNHQRTFDVFTFYRIQMLFNPNEHRVEASAFFMTFGMNNF